jgi:hypothetical protein
VRAKGQTQPLHHQAKTEPVQILPLSRPLFSEPSLFPVTNLYTRGFDRKNIGIKRDQTEANRGKAFAADITLWIAEVRFGAGRTQGACSENMSDSYDCSRFGWTDGHPKGRPFRPPQPEAPRARAFLLPMRMPFPNIMPPVKMIMTTFLHNYAGLSAKALASVSIRWCSISMSFRRRLVTLAAAFL